MFDSSSRYAGLETVQYVRSDGTEVSYKRRRFLPIPSTRLAAGEITVQQGDRIDLIAARTLGDPRLFWKIADLETTRDPFSLASTTGSRLKWPAVWVTQ